MNEKIEPILLQAGAPLEQARAAAILVHGRGSSAENMLPLVEALDQSDVAYLIPQAGPGLSSAWYPYPFMSPLTSNEPYLSNAIATLAGLFSRLAQAGIREERVLLAGFSQGACLSLEFVARGGAMKLGAVAGLSGGLIGPEGSPLSAKAPLPETSVFLGCSDVDPHIPKKRVLETAQVFEQLGARVTTRLYPNMAHTINDDEIEFVRGMLKNLQSRI